MYPNIELGMEDIENDLSKYGIMRLRYLHEHKREMYRELLLAASWPSTVRRLIQPLSSSPSRYRQDGLFV